jgi:hypothetical protein
MPDNLSEEDIERLADKMWRVARHDMYVNAGKGLFSLAWKGLVLVLIYLSLKGISGGISF